MVMVNVDAPRVTQDEATELMCHHLHLAAMYFEACPEFVETRAEVERLLKKEDRALAGGMPFYDALVAFYGEMKKRG